MGDASQPGSPFPFDFERLMRVMRSPGPINWEVARMTADALACSDDSEDFESPDLETGDLTTGDLATHDLGMFGGSMPELGQIFDFAQLSERARESAQRAEAIDPPIDAPKRAEVDEVARVAQLHVIQLTGLQPPGAVRCVTRREWSARSLTRLEPVLIRLSQRLGQAPTALFGEMTSADLSSAIPNEDPSNPFGIDLSAMLPQIMPMIMPMMLGAQAGSLVGQLARIAHTSLDVLLPVSAVRPADQAMVFVPTNIDHFEGAWELPRADLLLAIALREAATTALWQSDWLADHVVSLAQAFVDGYRIDPETIHRHFGDLDPSDATSLQGLLGRPDALLAAMRTPEQQGRQQRLLETLTVITGYVDHVTDHITEHVMPISRQVREALRRHRVVPGQAERFSAQLLGVELTREHHDLGRSFCRGVVERATDLASGMASLGRVFERAEHLPTRSELEAPGLWLARLEVMG